MKNNLINSFEVRFAAFRIGFDGFGLRLPVGRTDFAVFFDKLECLNQSKGFFDASANRQIINGDLSQNSLFVDYKEASQRHTLVLKKHVISGGYSLIEVTQQWITQVAPQTALLPRCVDPSQVTEVRVS